ncbi:Hpt domain-containing protein [Aliikangiella sp. IMCC44359]|uniref:Hpt domain-containing protein n=1 Tax=Aliikangiella sp. IMCC44359 TaxID=3459125 RepID=UPI00403B0C22
MSQISCEAFNELDDEIKHEFYEDVLAAIKDINECAGILEAGADEEVIDRMFRSLHTVKGNCNMVFLTEFVDASHKLEDLFSDIRKGDIEYHDTYGKFAVAVIGLIEAQLVSIIETGIADGTILKKIQCLIDTIENTQQEQRLQITEKAIIAIQDSHFNLELVAIDHEHGRAFSFLDATDLEFFQFISDQQINVDVEQHLFLTICETLVIKLNEKLGHSIEEQQLKVAVIFIALSKRLSSNNELSVEQIFFASGLLSRMAGWSIAAEVTLQVMESFDGSGSPLGLSGNDILPAAQALSLAIEFTYIVLDNQQSGYKQALFSAVKTINAQKDKRYKSRLIERFNQVIKSDYLTVQMW